MSVGELAIPRRISLVAVCCSNASARSRLRACSLRRSSLFSRPSLALVSLREERRFFDGGRLVVGILYLSAWPNPKSEYRNSKQSAAKINSKSENPKHRIRFGLV